MKNFNYIPHTPKDREEMLNVIGCQSIEELFKHIPEKFRKTSLNLPQGLSELELEHKMIELAKKNTGLGKYISFQGGGCYDRYIPAIIDNLVSRCEFQTAYTPYQPEISQGTLQAIYEYQTMICSLTGMDVANASMYDGATAAAEAALMACRITKKNKVISSRAMDPEALQVIQTYLSGPDIELIIAPINQDCQTDVEYIEENISEDVACVLIQMPNFLGSLEEVRQLEKIAHNAKALLAVSIDPISVGMIKPPGLYNADIAVGDGQSLGSPLMFGGPGFGFMACKQKYMRQMPGRIAGATIDKHGNRAFTLTLQTREQHIRREKATSNICTNHALSALGGAIYLATLGPMGIKELANICFQRAHFLASKIEEIPGLSVQTELFFNTFIMRLPDDILEDDFIQDMIKNNILAGIRVGTYFHEIPNSILITVTEKNSTVDMYFFLTTLKELCKKYELIK